MATILVGVAFHCRDEPLEPLHLFRQPVQTPIQQYWVAKLIGYDFTIEFGDRVFLKFWASLFCKLNVKLAPYFFGPFKVVARLAAAT